MTEVPPTLDPPTEAEMAELADQFGLTLTDEDLEAHRELIQSRLGAFEYLEGLSVPPKSHEHRTRDPGYRPSADEDPLNAIVTNCRVEGEEDGLLSDHTVGIKDNIAVRGVEMTCGSRVLDGYIPAEDAFVVTQVLDAGGTITAKTNMDEMAVSGSGEVTASGPIVNPHSEDHLAGGSSGGSAVAVVTGQVDVAIGTDQAGSLRVPAAWCGCVGLKPTHGLVSYRGTVPLGHSFDHVGPMTTTVDDNARVLEAIVGRDPQDPRQKPGRSEDYLDALTDDPSGLTIGVVEDGFGSEHADPAVDQAVRDAVDDLVDLGAEKREISIEEHNDGVVICMAVQLEETIEMWESDGVGYFTGGQYDAQFADVFGALRRARPDLFAPTVKHMMLLGGYLRKKFHGRHRRKAQNLRKSLTEAYDDVLEECDLLAMPTTPMTAFEREPEQDRTQLVNRAQGKAGRGRNTMPFDMTGHPAMSVPVDTVDGLPVGLMLVGSHFDERAIFRAASALERNDATLDVETGA
ncbi:amidase [Natrarchaeobius chitinivorans]|uniref:amidase n=1 Tax=Natrarchaeobius chitinivorans TaxID=1679083 RepID=UPI00140457A6|nr:amidase [Natrarchaeobius chitinivorans]